MALCMKCGMILNDEDAGKHICNPVDVPVKGFMKKPTTTTSPVGVE